MKYIDLYYVLYIDLLKYFNTVKKFCEQPSSAAVLRVSVDSLKIISEFHFAMFSKFRETLRSTELPVRTFLFGEESGYS